jgi:predicted cupin superfamily sugar epimerase
MFELTPEDLIEKLDLSAHPEGGYYREIYRDGSVDESGDLTSIYFLLVADRPSRWHRVLGSAEVWCFHGGSPLRLSVRASNSVGTPTRDIVLGMDLIKGDVPQHVVPPDVWQMAETLGDWSLVSCVVAPAFSFSNFELI